MGNYIRFTDMYQFSNVEIDPKIRDFYNHVAPQAGQSLRIRIAATHSGKITRNNGFYLPHKMKVGASTFTDQYPKPVQVHHEESKDPVGRVVASKYVDISHGIRDSWDGRQLKDNLRPISDTLLDAFCQGKLSARECVEIADKYFIKDLTISEDPDYHGLGYVEIIADITDPDAIQKILDKRYLTGSVGASTNAAICSICKKDWAQDEGRCEHLPGKVYDEKGKCVLIAGDFIYDEWSFVNKPADRHSGVIEVNVNGIQDFIKTDNVPDRIPEVSFILDDNISGNTKQEDNLMLFKDAFARVSKIDLLKNTKGLEDAVNSVLKEEDFEEDKLEALVADKLGLSEDYAKLSDDNQTDVEDQITTIKDFFSSDVYDELVGDDPWGADYAQMLYTLMEDATDENREEIVAMIMDAKLSSEKRKSLSSSTFCGPERSFPVNDCAHYTAALRLLNRYKGPGDKGRIKACIQRKGQRMGCALSKKDAVQDQPTQYTVESFDHLENDELNTLLTVLADVFKERELDFVNPAVLEELQNQVKDLTAQLEDAKAQVGNEELQTRLDSARKEIKYLYTDIEQLEDMLLQTQGQVRDQQIQRVVDFTLLSGSEENAEEVRDQVGAKSSEELETLVKDLSGKVDTVKIADILNSGLSNNPTGVVDDPSLKVDNTQRQQAQPVQVTPDLLDRIREKYLTLRFDRNNGQAKAEQFLQDCKNRGLIPHSYTIS